MSRMVRILGAWFRDLTPAHMFSRPVVLGVGIELIVVQLASPYHAIVDAPLRVAFQIIVIAGYFVALRALVALLAPRVSESALRIAVLLSVPLVSAGGGIFLGWIFHLTGIDEVPLLALRTFATCLHMTTMTVLLWTAVSSIRRHYGRLQSLADEDQQLQLLDQRVQQQLADTDAEATETVRARIAADLAATRSLHAPDVIAQLTAVIEDLVRPLSRQLESQAARWAAPAPPVTRDFRIDWRAAAVNAMTPELVSPIGLIVMLSLIATPMNVVRSGWLFHLEFLGVMALIVLPAFVMLRRATSWVTVRSSSGGRAALFITISLLTGSLIGVGMLPYSIDTPAPWRFFYLGPLFTLIIASAWGFAVAAQRQAVATERRWHESTEHLAWRIARDREEHRQRRRALAHAVHGQVQAAVAAGILQLDAAVRSGTASPQLVQEVRERIVTVVNELDMDHSDIDTFESIVRKVRAAWSGIAGIDLDISEEDRAAVEMDAPLMVTLSDLLPELVFNSIRHGRATSIAVQISREGMRRVCVLLMDNGHLIDGNAPTGMGTQLLNDCALHWERSRRGNQTLTRVILPFAENVSQLPS